MMPLLFLKQMENKTGNTGRPTWQVFTMNYDVHDVANNSMYKATELN